jgi:hypothetical protein
MYRAGIFTVAAGLALLAAALRSLVPGPLVDLAFVALLAAAPLAALSGVVSCTPGCPLPPHEPTSLADLTHASASIGALLLAAAAMCLLAVAPTVGDRLRLVSRIGAVLAVPLLALAGLSILVIGRGYVTGLLERTALVVALGWLAAASMASIPGGRRSVAAVGDRDRA